MPKRRRMIERNREFYDAIEMDGFFHYPDTPTALPATVRSHFITYVISELVEFGQAVNIVDQADAMADVLYFVLNIFLEMGLDPDEIHKIVHDTNMAKRWPDGQFKLAMEVVPPKLLKPPNWVPPILRIANHIAVERSKHE